MADSIGEAVKGDRITGNDACLQIPPRYCGSPTISLDIKNGSFDPGMEHAWMLALQKGDEGNRRPFVFHFLRSKSVPGNIVDIIEKITTPRSQPDANALNMHQFQHYKKVMK
ncbi:hypothetical protein Golob_014280, partial [Gossypium lobatum]|nr:hypothetical protein [Gossypium lobatum]